jgi:hypothetical protein
MKKTNAVLVVLMAASMVRGEAQPAGAAQQVESVQQRRQLDQSATQLQEGDAAPDLYPGETSDTGPQSVLRIKPRKTWFEAQADVQYFYTDNMLLSDGFKQEADVLVSTVELALAPSAYPLAGGQFTPRIGYRHQWFDYGLWCATLDFTNLKLREFDFNAQAPFADLRWSRDNWIFEVGFDYQRLMTTESYEQFYQEYVPRWGVQRLIPLCEASVLALGYAGDYRFTDEDVPFSVSSDLNDRTDHSLFANLTVTVCKHAVVQPYYRFKYTHFTHELADRDDYLHSFGIAVHCFLTRNISVRGFVGYDLLESSNDLVPEYRKLDTGGGVNFNIRF